MRRFLPFLSAACVLLPGAAGAQGGASANNSTVLEQLAKGEGVRDLPSADSIAPGARTIPSGATVSGTIVARGPVVVSGRVEGSVVSLAGDVTVRTGGMVTGDALAVGGQVRADSGTVLGEMRSMRTLPALAAGAPVVVARSAWQQAMDGARLVAGTFGVLLIIAIGVLLFAGTNLDEVVGTLERRFTRAFWFGLLGQALLLPGLVVLVVALAVSLIGILLIPFAIVAYCIAVAGLVTLGFLAVARLVGGSLGHGTDTMERGRVFGTLALGVAMFFALWMLAALLSWAPLAAMVVRAAALAATWAAMTLGLGAAILSRAGTHRRVPPGSRPVELASWQTPTPLTGVVAARRPAAAREVR
jgi:hypothetical protein